MTKERQIYSAVLFRVSKNPQTVKTQYYDDAGDTYRYLFVIARLAAQVVAISSLLLEEKVSAKLTDEV